MTYPVCFPIGAGGGRLFVAISLSARP